MNLHNFSLSEVIMIVSLLLAFIGLVINLFVNNKNVKKQRADFFNKILTEFYSDSDIKEMFYKIEYNKFKYSNNNCGFHFSEEEKKMDKLLFYFDKVGKLYKMKMLSIKEVLELKYEILRVFNNNEVKKYLEFLDEWYKSVGEGKPFSNFRSLAEKLITM